MVNHRTTANSVYKKWYINIRAKLNILQVPLLIYAKRYLQGYLLHIKTVIGQNTIFSRSFTLLISQPVITVTNIAPKHQITINKTAKIVVIISFSN